MDPTEPNGVRVKGRDSWWTVLVIDPLAGPLVRAAYPFAWITPNVITAASVVVAAAAAAAFALGWLVAGGLLFQLSFLLDCTDGKLAWTRNMVSGHGSYVDAIGDATRFVMCTGALVYSLAGSETTAPGWVVLFALFPTIHYAIFTTGAAWPKRPAANAPLTVRASPLAFLRAAPQRLSKPGTTVDTEALAFTIGPIAGVPLYGVLAATAIDALRLTVTAAIRTREALRAGGSS
ncbi:MAG: CDP-alcohol phosphatidyltransferase family protein [Chloroflexota bacterium]|nr:CDP-alcohol phosphatidyltransferase family protein [Chloroflexota bacterium]